jgi:hypothetical protein
MCNVAPHQCRNGHDKVVETLLKTGADVAELNLQGKTALHVAKERQLQVANLDRYGRREKVVVILQKARRGTSKLTPQG